MAYDEGLAQRVREHLDDREVAYEEKRMFGGLALMVAGHMACGVLGQRLMVRLGEDGAAAALDEPHTAPMDFTGRPMRTMAFVEPQGLSSDRDLARWVDGTVAYVGTLERRG